METMTTTGNVIPGFLTVEQAAQALGISAPALYMRLRRGHYRTVRAGRTILLPDDVVLELFQRQRERSAHAL